MLCAGLVKVLTCKETDKILGVWILGTGAGKLILAKVTVVSTEYFMRAVASVHEMRVRELTILPSVDQQWIYFLMLAETLLLPEKQVSFAVLNVARGIDC